MESSVGHIVAKDIYGPLGEKIDSLSVRTPQTRAFYAMLRQFLGRVQNATFTARPSTPEGVHAFRFESPEYGAFHIAYAEDGAPERGMALSAERVEDVCGEVVTDYQGVVPASGAPLYLFDHE